MANKSIDLNADLGEGFGPWKMGDDLAMLDVVSSANIACGFHAGDPDIVRATVQAAKARGVAIGAHAGFPDLRGFGRRRMNVSTAELENMIAYQVGAVCAVASLEGYPITYVKTHGALGNMCNDDDDWAMAVGRGIKAVDPNLIFLVMPALASERAAERLGLAAFNEIYADRTYDDSFNLTDRQLPGAVLHDPQEAVAQIAAMLREGGLISTGGKTYPTRIDSVCVHGDNPESLAMAVAVRQQLEQAGFAVKPFAARA
ncbi:UPF0271 protein [Faunimonas pinastri]|uniref:5-oxoprolinase subunit A n=1 Tax=Faunimonas pinastri TaxID=1855383 RepID=A0A1H9E1Q9_9HYPH|nr:5-oxoprolinase subunit PxpA [Faunimonas pinastri]SEQ19679.1 UPF0271 protein [Faunimonas pinastri]